MRNGQQHHNHNNHKRMRGRNRRGGSGGHNPLTRVYESNGPDLKIRGTAHHIAEKYLQLARDAQTGGDPVSAESYLQHAEHYFRLIAAAQQQQAQSNPNYQPQPVQRSDQDSGDDEEGDEGDNGDSRFNSPPSYEAPPQQQSAPRPLPQNAPQPNISENELPAFITGGAPQQQGGDNEQGGNRFNRNRGRNRFNNNRNRGEGNFENRGGEGNQQSAEAAPVKTDPAE
jgi:hypothetical protein